MRLIGTEPASLAERRRALRRAGSSPNTPVATDAFSTFRAFSPLLVATLAFASVAAPPANAGADHPVLLVTMSAASSLA